MKKTLTTPSGKTNTAMRARNLALFPLLFACATPLFAADAPKDPVRQTSWGLYVDSREAYQMKTGGRGQEMLLVDVRDPIEIMFTGFADVVDANVPYMTNNRQKWNDKKSVFAMEVNPAFEPLVAKALGAQAEQGQPGHPDVPLRWRTRRAERQGTRRQRLQAGLCGHRRIRRRHRQGGRQKELAPGEWLEELGTAVGIYPEQGEIL
ncbi:MAG: hypothetical protein WCB21_01785 [Azonexus sp.]